MVVLGDESPEVSKTAAGDSSPSSAESSFRQIDDVFLQTQTRIWLGEVLQTRLNEQLVIADLLADGELLFEVSREIWKMMLTKRMHKKCIQEYDYEPFASRNSGRYMPYSNVDSFLKICKILGLAGIDLFSPSDVVEKKDTRKVCMCIRALSKKARLRHLNVPDFDIVMHSVAMPTDMVGYIRRSWELSQSGYTGSIPSPHQKLSQRSWQKHSNAMSGICDLYSEESDGTESKFVQSDSSATICSHNPCSQRSSNLITSPEVSSEIRNDLFDQCSVIFGVKDQQGDECIQCQQEAVHLKKLPKSLFSHHLEYGHHQDNTQPPSFVDLDIHLGGRIFNADCKARNSDKSIILDQIYNDADVEDKASVVGDSCECCSLKSNITDDQPAISAVIGFETFTGDSILLEREETISDGCACAGSCCSKANRTPETEFRSRYLYDVIEVSSVASVSPASSTASVSSASVALQNLCCDDHLHTEDGHKNVWFPESENSKLGGLSKKQTRESKSQNFVEYEAPGLTLTTKNEEPLLDGKDRSIGFSSLKRSLAYSDIYNAGHLDHIISSDNGVCKSHINSDAVDGEGKELFDGQSCFPVGFAQWDQKGKSGIAVVTIRDDDCGALSPSSVDSHEQNLQYIQTKDMGNALWHQNTKSVVADNDKEAEGVILQPNKYSPIACSASIILQKHEDSNPSCNVDKGKDESLHESAAENSDGADSPSIGIAELKPQRRPILKSVVKGSAVLGALLLLLQFRKNGRKKFGLSEKQSNQTRNVNAGNFSSAKEQKGHRVDGVYPSGKLKL
ncbi:hypothetical protein JCGZ_03111 [Jatropha curcas]|uniref:Calponin-homology (CH) domain-containing protein n=1 Tax=Jatropha curcas TaxID=180498 RepID=A0A067JDQ5_JATCU|nr:hypothetical protein JCGZ_03111 [Jatropha curcas]